jgi:hypothetical protein
MSTPKQLLVSKRKLFLAIVSIALICSLASGSIMYVVAQGGSTPITISSGIYPGAPTYTIYTDGTTYYAKNAYGVVSYYSTDAATTINTILTQLKASVSSIGGHIYCSDAITLTAPIIVPAWEGLTLEFVGKVTVTGSAAMIIGGVSDAVRTSTFTFSYLDGVNKSPDGIIINWGEWNTINIGRIENFDTALHFGPKTAQVGTSSDNRLVAGTVALSNTGVKLISYDVTESISQGNHVDITYLAGNTKGIWTTGDLTELNVFQIESHNIIGGVDQVDVQADNAFGQNIYLTGFVNKVAGVGLSREMIIAASWNGTMRIDVSGYLKLGNASSWGGLPVASATYRGDIVTLQGSGSDQAYICLKNDAGNYAWTAITTTPSSWLSTDIDIIADTNRVSTLGWTTYSLAGTAPSTAKMVILEAILIPNTVNAGISYIGVRPSGTSPTRYPIAMEDANSVAGVYYFTELTVGLNATQCFDYTISVGASWNVTSLISVLGYIS